MLKTKLNIISERSDHLREITVICDDDGSVIMVDSKSSINQEYGENVTYTRVALKDGDRWKLCYNHQDEAKKDWDDGVYYLNSIDELYNLYWYSKAISILEFAYRFGACNGKVIEIKS